MCLTLLCYHLLLSVVLRTFNCCTYSDIVSLKPCFSVALSGGMHFIAATEIVHFVESNTCFSPFMGFTSVALNLQSFCILLSRFYTLKSVLSFLLYQTDYYQ